MNNNQKLLKFYKTYNGRGIEDDIGYKSADFKKFASAAKRTFSSVASEMGFELSKFSVGHYDISGFFSNGDRHVYFSYNVPRGEIPMNLEDAGVRGFLYRTAKNLTDYSGGTNNFCSLLSLMDNVATMIGATEQEG